MRLSAGCEIAFKLETPTPLILMLRSRSGYGQWIFEESYSFSHPVDVTEYVDNYGNLCQRLTAPAAGDKDNFVITATAKAETADNIDVVPHAPLTLIPELPDNVLQFLLPSRYCQSDLLGDLALQIVDGKTPGYDQAEAIRRWIHENIEYKYGT